VFSLFLFHPTELCRRECLPGCCRHLRLSSMRLQHGATLEKMRK
jgi:hypothetical protein